MPGPHKTDAGPARKFSADQKVYIYALLRALKSRHQGDTGSGVGWKTILHELEDDYGRCIPSERYFREPARIVGRDDGEVADVARYLAARFEKTFTGQFDRPFDPTRIDPDVCDFIEAELGTKLNLASMAGERVPLSGDAEQDDDDTPGGKVSDERRRRSPRRLIPVLGAGALASALVLALLLNGEPEPEPEDAAPSLGAESVILESDLTLQGASPTLQVYFNLALPSQFFQRGEPQIAYAIDGGEETLIPQYGQADIPISSPAPETISVRLIFPDGSSEGPFTYPLNIEAAKADLARAHLAPGRWLDCIEESRGMISCAVKLDAYTLATIDHIRAGEVKDRLEIEVGLSAGYEDAGAVRTIPRPGQDDFRLLFPPLRQLYVEPVLEGGESAGIMDVRVRSKDKDLNIFEELCRKMGDGAWEGGVSWRVSKPARTSRRSDTPWTRIPRSPRFTSPDRWRIR